MSYLTHRLSNGIRLIHKPESTHVAHCGIMVDAGSRDESPEEHGIAHFIEHVIFKGTTKRKAFHILSHMENVGGEINAFTGKEDTCVFASFLYPYYERWFDVASDILFHSVFPEKELNKEKEIIMDEINAYLDSPSEQIFDDFDQIIFNSHPLGRGILGTPERIKTFNREMVQNFMKRNYTTEQMVICSVGRIAFDQLVRLAEKFFGSQPQSNRQHNRQVFQTYNPESKQVVRTNHQTHCLLGNQADGLFSSRKTALSLLINILGGPGLNSRLNMSVREKHGFCYNIESNFQPYSDTGMVNIYFGTDPEYTNKTISLIHKELSVLRNKKLGSLQIKRSKNQLVGQLAIAFESNLHDVLFNGKNFLLFDKTDTLEEIQKRIEAVTAGDLLDIANDVFDKNSMSMLIYKPG